MVQATRKNKFTIQVKTQNHILLSDVDDSKGGDDLGMSPHELLEAALAACTSMTVQMYATRKGWPLESCDTLAKIVSEGKENVIEVQIHLVGTLDEEQKARLLDIANKCPVHKILAGNVQIQVTHQA